MIERLIATPSVPGTDFIFSSVDEAITFAWERVGATAEYSGACSDGPPIGTWCRILEAASPDLQIHSIGKAYTSVFAGMVVLGVGPGEGVTLLGWDPAKTAGAGVRQVSGTGDCLNVRAAASVAARVLACLAEGSSVSSGDGIAWADGYVWL